MDRLPQETDEQYRSRLVNLPTGTLSEGQLAVLAARISALSPQDGKLSVNEVMEQLLGLCVGLPTNSRRSLIHEVRENVVFAKTTLGDYFIFMERASAVSELYGALKAQYSLKNSAKLHKINYFLDDLWERFKRQVKIPVTHGLGGFGKSRFAREALLHYARKLLERDDFQDEEDRAFAQLIVGETTLGNYRIGMDKLIAAPQTETQVVVALLYEFLKYCLIDADNGAANILSLVNKAQRMFSLRDAVNFIFHNSDITDLLVNIDEASQVSRESLKEVLKHFGGVLCEGLPIYFTVTGIYKGPGLEEADTYSGMERVVILLPPLTTNDCFTICRDFGLLSVGSGHFNPHFQHLVWLAGGVPRYLAFLIFTVALKVEGVTPAGFKQSDKAAISQYIANMSHHDSIAVLSAWKGECSLREKSQIPIDVRANLVSLCVSEESVEGRLGKLISKDLVDECPYTIERARVEELAFVTPEHRVAIPPIMLHHLHNAGQNDHSCFLVVLQNLDGVMNPRDNESLYASVVMHRMRALKLLGYDHTTLSRLLGVPARSGENDPLIDVRQQGSESSSVKAVQRTVTKAKPSASHAVNVGEVNTPTASYADCSIRFRVYPNGDFLPVRIQEKQETVARQKVVAAGDGTVNKAPRTVHSADVAHERSKVEDDGGIFVFITDAQAAQGEEAALEGTHGTIVITARDRDTAFGSYVGQLKLYCLSPSYIDAK